MNEQDPPKELRVRLGPKLREMIQEIKDDMLLENYSEIVRTLIKNRWDELQQERRAVDLSLKKEN